MIREYIEMMNKRTYKWAVINPETGRVLREANDRRAIFRTRDAARKAAKSLGGRVMTRTVLPASAPTFSSLTMY